MSQTKALFLDRDGVINVDTSYVFRREDFVFYEDLFTCLSCFKQNGYKLIVITNQSGIQRGYYTLLDFLQLSKYMQDFLKERLKFCFDRIYYCPSLHDEVRRKPAPGMILQAQKDFNINLSLSYLIGDKESDVIAGINAGIPNLFLLDREQKRNKKHGFYNEIQFQIIQSLEDILSI